MTLATLPLNLLADIQQYLPAGLADGTSLVVALILLVVILIAVLGIITALLDIAAYAVVIALALVGLFVVADFLTLDGAINAAQDLLGLLAITL